VFGDARLAEADAALTRIENAVRNIDWQLANTGAGDAVLDDEKLVEAARVAREAFIEAMDDDFNAPEAIGAIFTLVNAVNAEIGDKSATVADRTALEAVRGTLVELMNTLGIDVTAAEDDADTYPAEVLELAARFAGFEGSSTSDAVNALLEARTAARAAKDWGTADGIRDGLAALGLKIEDTAQGPRVV